MPRLQKIDWRKFELLNENPQKSFEDLCYHIFCRKYKLKEGIRSDYNQVGIETYPIVDKSKKLVGFQSKYFENKLSDRSSVRQIIHSLNNAKKSYKNLNQIIVFTHQSFGSKNPKYKKDIENAAKPIHIEWFTDSKFKTILYQPSNLDLAQLYFGLSEEIGFIKNNVDSDTLTFLKSSLYLDLPVNNGQKKTIIDFRLEIKQSTKNIFLITGNPGSGKSILMHKLLEYFGALDQSTGRQMILQLIKQGSVPTLINLKNCVSDSLENILRGRKNDSRIGYTNLKFIYLFDGLDELSENHADFVLSYISELKQSNSTQKIIISCRTGNLNKIKARSYFNDIVEYNIANLDLSFIDKYFSAKYDTNKMSKLLELKSINPNILNEIKDILLINLLWDTIDELNDRSIITDLIEMKINMLINNPKHRKNIEALNLLNPKVVDIISINQDISFEFQLNFQYRFPQKRLQEIILNKYPRLDYLSVNIIINYIADLFFDIDYSFDDHKQSYVYQHRRYQEIFFVQKLKELYENDPAILRKINIFSNKDLFENLFLKYLRRKYEQ